ncbi:protein GRINL1A [Corythoichthys intestinalis]|uniref:protein GRINL1A n=1 Tax=Corythoichthys intestinalis TaxID=161448 RepID=UPI0025A50726|nr:protein GRINL1A [Corythoichthys intestinalis]XP_061795992.1 protein GRINL1A [Nerophis lumbriciformis]
MSERQGQVGDLNKQSREQLHELLLRQNNILSNKSLIVSLPDKGQKIRDFAERIRLAIERQDEEERRQSLVSAARAEFQSKYRQAFAGQQRVMQTQATASQHTEASPVCVHAEEDEENTVETMETAAAGASLNSVRTKEAELAETLERVTISGARGKDPVQATATVNYFLSQQTKKPHVVTVLERTENTMVPVRQKFKPNQPANRSGNSPSGSSSPGRSSEGSSPLSAQARRERDRKHLDDITAAKLPPLHHAPAQLITLQESADLLREQTKKQQALQAKLAAQKLSEGLKISMESYSHDNGSTAAYREVHDEGAQPSSEED